MHHTAWCLLLIFRLFLIYYVFYFGGDYLSKEQSQNQQPNDLRIRSKVISEGVSRTPNRSYLRALGFEDEDFEKPMIGVASTWSEVTPCNMHIDGLARTFTRGMSEARCSPLSFNTITVSDAISMGTDGMLFSLPSR